MLTALIVKLYKWLVELMLWVFIVAGGIAASRMDLFVDIALNADWFIDKEVVGFISGALAAFFVAAIIFGAVLILIEIRKSLQRIETQLERNTFVEEEPTLIPPPIIEIQNSLQRIETLLERNTIVEEEPTLILPPIIEIQNSLQRIETLLERNTSIEEEPTPIPPPSPVGSSAGRFQQRAPKPRQGRKSGGRGER